MNDWIKCSDRLPEEGSVCWVYSEDASMLNPTKICGLFRGRWILLNSFHNTEIRDVTHWILLDEPELPEPEEDDN